MILLLKKLTLLALLAAPVLAIAASAPHPTVLMVKYKDEMLPVVKMKGKDPFVRFENKEKRLRNEPLYLTQRAPSFSPLTAQFISIALGGTQIRTVYSEADTTDTRARYGNHGGIAEYSVTIKADQPVRGGFIAVVIYTPMVFYSKSPYDRTQIVVSELPNLPAGVEVPLKVSSKMFTYLPGQQYFVQLFDNQGREIYTPAAETGWDYYAAVERFQLGDACKRYVEKFAGADHAAAPVVMPRTHLKPGMIAPKENLDAILDISAEGRVTGITLPRLADSALEHRIREALGGWLFFPRLVSGTPVESKVQVPVLF